MRAITPIPFKPHRLKHFSVDGLLHHYESVYGGLLQRINANAGVIESTELDLHEWHFASLGGADGLGSPVVDPEGDLLRRINSDFGSVTDWSAAFKSATGEIKSNSSNWLLLAYRYSTDKLENTSTTAIDLDPDLLPLIVMATDAQVYKRDFGINIQAYADAFIENLHWQRAAQRLELALNPAAAKFAVSDNSNEQISAEQLSQSGTDEITLLDICLGEDLAARYDTIPGARFVQAETQADWMAQLARDQPVVSYCMYGFQVSKNAAARLRKNGYDARILTGGIAAWRAIGGATLPLPRGAHFDA